MSETQTRSARLHDALAAHVSQGAMPGVVALVSRRGETRVEAIGRQSFEAGQQKGESERPACAPNN